MSKSIKNIDFSDEFFFQTSRSSGPGGQHVNKTETRVTLRFNVLQSKYLTVEQKELIQQKLPNQITEEGELIISNQESRSQATNKEKCIYIFYELLRKTLHKPKKRKPTKPTLAAKTKRLESKKQLAEKKQRRQKPDV